MGASILSTLTEIRTEIAELLTEAGIKAREYVPDNANPPLALVVPADPWITTSEANTRLQFPFKVTTLVVLIGGKASNKAAQTNIDSMVQTALVALDDWEVTQVTAPMELSIKGIQFSGVVMTLETDTNMKEVI